jgi:eukaryotic-like serine/threonine-protein kinase
MAEVESANVEKPEPRIGSYRLLQPLGSGGMSSVFRAVHVETDHEVAVKVLPRNLARNNTLLQRFLREAKSAEALEHPNIVAIYDRGVDQGRHYLVLEYVSGGDLHDWVRAGGPMSVTVAVGVIRSVAEGLRFAAGRGLIHRDIKPANLLMTPEGGVKITDLGLALHAESEDERVTREGTTVGTVDYMAPEQARDSRATSLRSDIYSLGCTFFFLLTGQAPFPGGDVADKLTRHCSTPPPDPREFQPLVPVELTRLIHKMMAKRPERRFGDYDELIAALDSLSAPGSAPAAEEPVPLLALFDDEPDDAEPVSDGFLPLSPPGPDDPHKAGTGDFSMADLARLDANDAGERVDRKRAPRPPSAVDLVPPDVLIDPEPEPVRGEGEFFEEEEDAFEGKMPGQVAFPSHRRMSDAERSWLTTCILAGIGLIVFVIGIDQLFRSMKPTTTSVDLSAQAEGSTGSEPEVVAPIPVAPVPPVATSKPAPAVKVAEVKKKKEPVAAPSSVWVEPIDPVPEFVAEASYPSDFEARFRPDWASADVSSRLAGRISIVRRVPDPREPDEKPTLRAALDIIDGGTVEVADNGPFFEDDMKVAGKARQIRARPGFRPIICLESPTPAVASQPALIELDGRSLILDGLDLIVDARNLAKGQTAVFLCRGGALTLRDCTVTVANRGMLPVSLVQVQTGSSQAPSRIRLERTLVRGSLTTIVDLVSGAADVVVSRSVLLNGQGSAVAATGSATAQRQVFLSRSVVATRGPSFEMTDPPQGGRPQALGVRALGSTFARISGPGQTSLLSWRGQGGGAKDLASWQGEFNTFQGWSSWLAVGDNPPSVRVAGLAAARTIWAGTDAKSLELPSDWPLSIAAERVAPHELLLLAAGRADVLTRVGTPSALLFEKTLERFRTPFVPGLTAMNTLPAAPIPSAPRNPMNKKGMLVPDARFVANDDPRTAVAPSPGAPSPGAQSAGETGPFPPLTGATAGARGTPPGVRELRFNAEATPWMGDLGVFLAECVKGGDRLVRVRVSGSSVHTWSPCKLPAGVSLELVVVPDPARRVPSWKAARSAAGEALVEVSGASLSLSNVTLTRDGSGRLKSLFRVDGGHLLLRNCHLKSSGEAEPGGGGLIAFHAPGSRPLKVSAEGIGTWPFEASVDRPTCLISDSVLISVGGVLSAGLGRGLVAVAQSVVAAGGAAFTLTPDRVARRSLDADLWLEHCTIASENAVVALGPWRGSEPGPDRPWLVSSHKCAFFASYQGQTRESVMLRADRDALAHGALFWQASGDAVELTCFAVTGEALPVENRRPDVHRQWSGLWGSAHVRAVSGPHPPAGAPSARTVVRLKPGGVEPGDLALDPTYPSDGGPPRDVGADFARLGIIPTPRASRRR